MVIAISATRRHKLERLVKFGAVGATGIGVNLVAQAVLIEALHLNYVVAAIIATQVSSTTNFLGNELWVFDEDGGSKWGRYLAFMAMSSAALILRVPIMWVLTSVFGVFYTISNLISLFVLTLVRFLLADGLIWRNSAAHAPETLEAEELEDLEASEKMDAYGTVIGWAQSSSGVITAPPPTGYQPHHLEEIEAVGPDDGASAEPQPPRDALPTAAGTHPERWILAACVVVGTFLRVWQLTATGLNSDETVYAGQAAAIAGDHGLRQFFPVIRAHPMLFQGLLSLAYHFGTSELVGRLAAVAFGVGTIVLAYHLAKLLYGRRAGVAAALIVALMPYQVIVDRQILLDAPTAFFATLALYLLARYASEQRPGWLIAAAGAVGLTVLSKEPSVVLIVSMFAFLALSPEIRVRFRDIVLAAAVFVAVVLPFPAIVVLAGRAGTGKSYLSWQLFRRPNHPMGFYVTTLPWYVGPLVLALAVFAAVMRWRVGSWSWREWLLLCWALVPAVFFQLWPVKGFQYLLGAAIPVAVLAAAGLSDIVGWLRHDRRWVSRRTGKTLGWVVVGALALSLVVPAWTNTQSPPSTSMLAGTGGMAGGREAGSWLRKNSPEGSEVVTIGPSMANLVQFYGRRKAYGLSVSPNALDRNPSYEPLRNPDLAFRTSQVQYVVWDAYSSSRTSFFSNRLGSYVGRYHGRVVFTYQSRGQALVKVFEVRP